MEKRKTIKMLTEALIEETDIKYTAHYRFENLEWMITDLINENIGECTKDEKAEIVHNVFMYVFRELETEKYKFIRYSLPVEFWRNIF